MEETIGRRKECSRRQDREREKDRERKRMDGLTINLSLTLALE